MKRGTKHIILAFTVVLLTLIAGCKKFVEINSPPDQIFSSDVFEDEASATSAMTGLYSEMTRTNLNFANGALTIYAGLAADELYRTTASASIDVFTVNEIPSTNSILRNNLWTAPYSHIYHANAVIEGLQRAMILDSVKQHLRGEALLTRALCYFYLVNLYGDVPLILTTDYRTNATLPRTSVSAVYNQIIIDLQNAKTALLSSYPTSGRLRPNRWTAAALLSRVYLYTGQWEKAEGEASEIISSGTYSLGPITTPLSASNEVIWQLGRETQNTSEGITFIPSSATVRPVYALTDTLVKSFETGDLRKTNWLKSNTVSGVIYFYPFKYKAATGTTVTERLIVFRYSEILLIRAEARTEQNNTTGALADLNVVRTRAGLSAVNTTDQGILRNAIHKERQVELFAEWGHRWFDLKRWGKTSNLLSTLKPVTWQLTDVLFPIPFAEIEANPFLTQNPGY